ncbi:CaiB/BaiF CoA transferase family protein [Gulosibacter chungangensis]|uniref:CoA transferase n=1 Tax=Gulosibacter chungangensis TaxID=979746 RepID=A0A7J5BHM0_9MICO|nr:CaiB/BaiF CoA-transferase family protein [Gulosibacter chungangensis]KAB1645120.1 CoA transferase [Gulosibacter chungangensis]
MNNTTAPLAGVRVLELGSMYAAPTAGRMLRDFGADVVKVEEPVNGDMARQWQPQKDSTSIGYVRLNSGKRSVGVDLRKPEGQQVVRELIAQSDIVIESFRPGRLEKWGMSYDSLAEENPGLILTRVSGFGQTGPYSARPGFGTVAETASGFAFLNGWPETPPTAPPFGFADSIAGISAAMGAAMALYQRSATGKGSVVDVALYEPLMFILGDAILNYTTTGKIMQRHGNASGAASPRGIYQGSDGGWLAIAASAQSIAMRLFDAMGRPELKEDPRYATNEARMANNELVQQTVREWVGSMPRDEVLAILDRNEVVAAAVNDSSDIVEDEHFLARTLQAVTNTPLGRGLVPGPVLHIGDYAGPSYDGLAAVGENTAEVLAERLGYDDDKIASLSEIGAISSQFAGATS